ncbi:hypothetical protein OQA88_7882 [Cercophora sp. LCS_1]
MGRTQPSLTNRAPPSHRKDVRAKKARATINKLIPSLLSTHPRARDGIAASQLLTPSTFSFTSPPSSSSKNEAPAITLRVCTTLSAAHTLVSTDLSNRRARVAVLNMASPLSPGGGFLNGATAQEEYLCMRTTLLPSLRDEFYRLPEVGVVWTPDVLVFRDDKGEDLKKGERWFVDVVSGAMLRGPETEGERYASARDREVVEEKMRFLMGVLKEKGTKKVVLGAWGCGAYGNPVGEVARAWRAVLLSGKGWGVEEVVFAISERGVAERFGEAFGEGMVKVEEADGEQAEEEEEEEEEDGEGQEVRDLEARIAELEASIGQARSTQLREGLVRVVAGLKERLRGAKGDDGE